MKVLNIVETAYRGTLEEQDDTVVWICDAMKGAGADLDVLFRGHAVNYAIKTQDASGLCFGTQDQTQPPRLASDVAHLHGKGAKLYLMQDALVERGIDAGELIEGVELVPRTMLGKLLAGYDQVWHW